jgi:hypothetical protein
MAKRPAFQFYPSDWRTDLGLRLCSISARGLWADILCLMHEGEPYGHLTADGRPVTVEQLARLVGEGAKQVRGWLGELRDNDVFSETDGGVIFSRRMVRDEEIRNARGSGGVAGAEHGAKGAAHGKKGGRPRKEKPPLEPPFGDAEKGALKPPPSSSSSSSPSGDDVVGDAGATALVVIPFDIPGLTDEICRAAGIRHVDPSRIIEHQRLVKEWLGEGLDPVQHILPAIRTAVAQATDRINSLRWFAQPIRQTRARMEAQTHGHPRTDRPRGVQPSAALELVRRSDAAIAAGGSSGDDEADWSAWAEVSTRGG